MANPINYKDCEYIGDISKWNPHTFTTNKQKVYVIHCTMADLTLESDTHTIPLGDGDYDENIYKSLEEAELIVVGRHDTQTCRTYVDYRRDSRFSNLMTRLSSEQKTRMQLIRNRLLSKVHTGEMTTTIPLIFETTIDDTEFNAVFVVFPRLS